MNEDNMQISMGGLYLKKKASKLLKTAGFFVHSTSRNVGRLLKRKNEPHI